MRCSGPVLQIISFFFFFQAEDGIRDLTVTGVQTCALPIFATFIIFNTFSIVVAQRLREMALLRALGASGRQVMGSVLTEAVLVGLFASVRSEERRVGKECRSRWSPYH